MCYVIDSENLLFNYFATHSKKQVRIRTLNRLRSIIEQSLDSLVYVDVTSSSLVTAIENNEGMFDWRQDSIFCLSPDAYRPALARKRNWRLPSDMRARYVDLVKSAS